jgi:RNA polymerase sigma-70 factor (ECF subfamily)
MSLQLQTQHESSVLQLVPHLDAAYNLARWLVRDQHNAEDMVQEAYARALQHIAGFTGLNGRAWLLTIVRNCCYDLFKRNGTRYQTSPFDERTHGTGTTACDPETALLEGERAERLRNALTELQPNYREVLVLREMEELSYKEISGIVGVPIGTVMSRLSRARNQLQQNLASRATPAPASIRNKHSGSEVNEVAEHPASREVK